MPETTRRGPGLPLHDLMVDPALIPARETLTPPQLHGWACVFCATYTGGDAPCAGRMPLPGNLAACFQCYRTHGTPRAAA